MGCQLKLVLVGHLKFRCPTKGSFHQGVRYSTLTIISKAMSRLKILICGGGIAGNALAFWLSKLSHDVTVIERWPGLRTSGLQLDLRGHGIEDMKRMGLDKAIRSKCANEAGTELLDSSGKSWA